jgi:hypothetical protein
MSELAQAVVVCNLDGRILLYNNRARLQFKALAQGPTSVSGGALIGHRHPQVEELYVLEGSCVCAGEFLQAGDYHRAEAGTVHPVTSSEQGCLALVMTSSKNEPIR